MDRLEARQILRRINQLHFELADIKRMEEEIKERVALLRVKDHPVGLIHADFIEECGRYVFIDDLMR